MISIYHTPARFSDNSSFSFSNCGMQQAGINTWAFYSNSFCVVQLYSRNRGGRRPFQSTVHLQTKQIVQWKMNSSWETGRSFTDKIVAMHQRMLKLNFYLFEMGRAVKMPDHAPAFTTCKSDKRRNIYS